MSSLASHLLKIVVFLVIYLTKAQNVYVTTKYGILQGESKSFDDNYGTIKRVNTFLGVPFASPPVGKLRLQAPVPPCVWKPAIYNATQYRNVCIQDDAQHYKNVWPSFDPENNIAEDCLYLNIYAPHFKALYPVMVFIHGGGFNTGASILWPGYQLALRGVVVVTIQYRLGPLGFLSNGDQAIPGNYGLLDQVQALKWVEENIEHFNGNPFEVTLFGAGAGATSIGLHLFSPLSENLFHRVILESAFDISSWPMHSTRSTIKHSKALAKTLGCYQTKTDELLKCLQNIEEPKNFLRANSLFSSWGLGAFWFGPIVDNSFLPDRPSVLRKKGMFHKVPLIAGINANESSLYLAHKLKTMLGVSNVTNGIDEEVFNKYCNEYSRALQPRSSRLQKVLFDALSFEYYPWFAAQDDKARLRYLIDLTSDFLYGSSLIATLAAHSKHTPTYMYVFNYRYKVSPDPLWAGVPHGSSSRYFLELAKGNLTHYDVIDNIVSDSMVTMWTNMAKYGKPTPKPVNDVTWKHFTVADQDYMNFDGGHPVARMAGNFFGSRAAFWNYYYPSMMRESQSCPKVSVKSAGESPYYKGHFLLSLLIFCYLCVILR